MSLDSITMGCFLHPKKINEIRKKAKTFKLLTSYMINKFKEIISLGPQWSDKDLYSVFLSY